MNHPLKRMMFSSVELFCLVAEYESFSKAALHAGVSPAAVSRSIARLEKHLATPLFVRTTRQVRLTTQGKIYFDECKQALNQILEAEQQLKNQTQQPSGLIRLVSVFQHLMDTIASSRYWQSFHSNIQASK